MGRINLLSFAVANLIAAGEVVDRPASVIKELMENSIDAGATRIMVEVQHGGTSFMRVTDNGCGIPYEELPMALRRHATSKIKDQSDLDAIISLGFRGEALAAISSVSKLRIISKTADGEMGASIEAEGGTITSHETRGAPEGTTVIIEDLFYNVPARRKFLKKDTVEGMAVSNAVEKIALSHPEVRIGYISDGNVKLETSGDGKLINAIYSIYGRDFAQRLLPVESNSGGITVKGYISRPDNVKATRASQSFFINGRYVKSGTMMAALEQAFSSYIQPERFPCAVLFLDINPMLVDVNVHPSKLEIKFSNESAVFEAVYYAVKSVLAGNVTRPELSLENGRMSASDYRKLGEEKTASKTQTFKTSQTFEPKVSSQGTVDTQGRPRYTVTPAYANIQERPRVPNAISSFVPIADSDRNAEKPTQLSYGITAKSSEKYDLPKDKTIVSTPSTSPTPIAENAVYEQKTESSEAVTETTPATQTETVAAEMKNEKQETREPEVPFYRILGEAFNSYIFLDTGEKVLIIDKHAAHERLIFEKFKRIMAGREEGSQLMLIPMEVSLGKDECEALDQYRTEIESLGFTFEIDRSGGDGKVSVTSSPTGLDAGTIPEIFGTLGAQLASGTGDANSARKIIFERALYQASCKAAIKAGRIYPEGHIEWLCRELMKNPDITYCPHGRPVAIEMTKSMLDRRFERT